VEIDFSNRNCQRTLDRATELILAGYRILRDEVGVDNPADNAFLREARVCAIAGVIWVGDRGGADGRTVHGDEVEIKSTRLDGRPSIQFPTSRYVSPTVIARFRQATFWLFAIFDVYEVLIGVYRVEAFSMAEMIAALEEKMRLRAKKGLSLENNPKIPFAAIFPAAQRLYLHADFIEVHDPLRGWTIKQR
jgi:Restriction endonuclease PvuII